MVSKWVREIQKVTKLDRDPSNGTALQEISFWLNLERALLLSLKYQFVTPLTSLVVVKPDVIEDGDIQEADMFNRKIRVMSGTEGTTPASSLTIIILALSLVSNPLSLIS